MRLKTIVKKMYFFLTTFFSKRVIRGKRNKITITGGLKNTSIYIKGNDNIIEIGKNTRMTDSSICILGDNSRINILENCTIDNSKLLIEDNNGTILIGNNFTSGQSKIYCLENDNIISIGNDCMFSSGIQIRNSDAHSIINIENRLRINASKKIIIDDHVWVGANAAILKGVHIESNSIIGYGSIVTRDVKANTIVAGNPAKCIKNNVDWVRTRQ